MIPTTTTTICHPYCCCSCLHHVENEVSEAKLMLVREEDHCVLMFCWMQNGMAHVHDGDDDALKLVYCFPSMKNE